MVVMIYSIYVCFDCSYITSNIGWICSRLNEFLEFADDIAIDVPKFWPYIAEVIGKSDAHNCCQVHVQ
jgi:hypothetical protein